MQVVNWRKYAGAGAKFACMGLVLTALAHTSWARLAWLKATGSTCPFGFGGSVQEQDAQYRRKSAALRQGNSAPSKPAPVFDLQTTQRADFVQRIQSAGGHCLAQAETLQVECGDVDVQKLSGAPRRELVSVLGEFDLSDRLRAVTLVARVQGAEPALEAVDRAEQLVSRHLGRATQQVGQRESGYLEAAPLRQVKTTFAFSDYHAEILATNMGALGYYSVIETYQKL